MISCMNIKDLFSNKIFFFSLSFLIFGAVSIFAGSIIVNESGIRMEADNYFSAQGNEGISFNLSLTGSDGNYYNLLFENGLIINFSQVMLPSETINNNTDWGRPFWNNQCYDASTFWIQNVTNEAVSIDAHGISPYSAALVINWTYNDSSTATNQTGNIGSTSSYSAYTLYNPNPNKKVQRICTYGTLGNWDVLYYKNMNFVIYY